MAHDPNPDPSRPRKQRSIPHVAQEIEVSAGAVERKHFGGPLERHALLFLLILHQTKHRSVRWRRGEWHPVESLAQDTGKSVRSIQRALRDLEATDEPGPYLDVRRGPRGVRIFLLKRVWFRGRQAMLTTLLPDSVGGDRIVTPPESLGVTGLVAGGDNLVTPSVRCVTPWASEAAPDAGFVIPPQLNPSDEQASPSDAASLSVRTLPDPDLPWPPMPRRPKRGGGGS